jgi:isocitrate lyase
MWFSVLYLISARLAADVMGVPTILIARTMPMERI